MKCKLCESEKYIKRDGSVRDDASLEIYECSECGLVYLSSLEHINDSFYEDSGMHEEVNFTKWQKETQIDDARRFEFVKNMITNKTVLDFGSGNGGFLKLAKQLAKNASGAELEKGVKPYYKKEGIELYANIEDVEEKVEIITAFHVLEHLPNPQVMLQTLANLLVSGGKLIVEVPNANDALLSIYKNEAFSNFTYWSCHLYLYNQHTLSILAKKAG